MIGRRFRDEIIKLVAVPYSATIGDNFMLIDDHRPHRANLNVTFFSLKESHEEMTSVFSGHELNIVCFG